MRLIPVIEQPSMSLPFSACAPSAAWLPVSAPVATPAAELSAQAAPVALLVAERPAQVASVAILAAERAPVAGAHQVSAHRYEGELSAQQAQIQSELVRVLAGVGGSTLSGNSTTSFTGFKGSNGTDLAMKRRTGDARGVPPRGRPV